jgi:hypothetical protein
MLCKPFVRRSILAAGVLAACLSGVSVAAPPVQGLQDHGPLQLFSGRIAVVLQIGDPKVAGPAPPPINIRSVLDGQWDRLRPQAEDRIKKEVGNLARKTGHTAYGIQLFVARRGQLYAQTYFDHVDLHYVLRQCALRAKLTQDSFLGSSFDPGFQIDFDLDLTLQVTTGAALQVRSPVEARIQNAHIRGTNVPGAFAGLAGFGKLENLANAQTFSVPLNESLRGLLPPLPPGYQVTAELKP